MKFGKLYFPTVFIYTSFFIFTAAVIVFFSLKFCDNTLTYYCEKIFPRAAWHYHTNYNGVFLVISNYVSSYNTTKMV